MIDKKTQEKYSTPERTDQENKAEQFSQGMDKDEVRKATGERIPKSEESKRPYKPIDYDDPPKDDEPGYKEW
jgi:hypothetical protein